MTEPKIGKLYKVAEGSMILPAVIENGDCRPTNEHQIRIECYSTDIVMMVLESSIYPGWADCSCSEAEP